MDSNLIGAWSFRHDEDDQLQAKKLSSEEEEPGLLSVMEEGKMEPNPQLNPQQTATEDKNGFDALIEKELLDGVLDNLDFKDLLALRLVRTSLSREVSDYIYSHRVVGVNERKVTRECRRLQTRILDVVGPEHPLFNSFSSGWVNYRILYAGFFNAYQYKLQTYIMGPGDRRTRQDIQQMEISFPFLKNVIVWDRKQIIGCGLGKLVPLTSFRARILLHKDLDYRNVNSSSNPNSLLAGNKFCDALRGYEVLQNILRYLPWTDILALRAVGNWELNENLLGCHQISGTTKVFVNENELRICWGDAGLLPHFDMMNAVENINPLLINTFAFYGFVSRRQKKRTFHFDFTGFCEEFKDQIKYVYVKNDAHVSIQDLNLCLNMLVNVRELILHKAEQVVQDIRLQNAASLADIPVNITILPEEPK